MPISYKDIGLNDNLINQNSLLGTSNFVSAFDFDSKYDTASVAINKLNKLSIFKLSDKVAFGTYTIGVDAQLTVNTQHEISGRREIRPMLTMADLYITQRDDTHLYNSVNLHGDLTADQDNNTDFWFSMGQRQNELDKNTVDVMYQVTNWGTASYTYLLDHRLVFIPLK